MLLLSSDSLLGLSLHVAGSQWRYIDNQGHVKHRVLELEETLEVIRFTSVPPA